MRLNRESGAHVDDENVASTFDLRVQKTETDWRSIYVTSMLAFCTAAQFSLYFSSLWPFIELLDKTVTENFFGYIVGAYSLGQIVASPLVGYISNRLGQIQLPLYANLMCMFAGNAIYLFLESFRSSQKYWLLLGRLITGFGSSNISLLKAYTTTASTTADRSRAIAFVTGGVALGTTMGPAFQLLFIPLDYPGLALTSSLNLNMYTAPAYTACFMNLFCALITKFFFEENYAGLAKTETGEKVRLPSFDRVAVGVCYLTRFTQILVSASIETLGAPLAMAMFAWSRHDVVEYIAAAQGVMSFLAFLTYFLFIVLKPERFISFRVTCLASLCGLVGFYLITFSWSFLPGQPVLFYDNSTSAANEQLGCNASRFSWCVHLKPVNPVVFFVAYIIIVGTAFPNVNIALNTLFSKIIGPRKQGTQQGMLQVSGALARMFGPVAASIFYTNHGPRLAWSFVLAVIGLTILAWALLYRRMVPLKYDAEDQTTLQDNMSDQDKVT